MKTYAEYDVQLPSYSLSYLVNGDSSGIDEEDVINADRYMDQFYDEAKEVNGSVVIDILDDEPHFSHHPAFGLASDVVDAKIVILVSGKGTPKRTRNDDPDRDEMIDYLTENHSSLMEEADEFDVEAALYWFSSDYHGGQNSNLYSVLSSSEFNPSPLHSSVVDESEIARDIYYALVEQFTEGE